VYEELGISVTYDLTRRVARIESRPATPWATVSAEDRIPRNPTGGSSLGARDDRSPRVRSLQHSTLKQHHNLDARLP
jgi:hypothetical protein